MCGLHVSCCYALNPILVTFARMDERTLPGPEVRALPVNPLIQTTERESNFMSEGEA